MTSLGSVRMAEFLGLNAFIEYGTLINIEGKRLSIVSECTSLSYILIFASAVIAYPASSLSPPRPSGERIEVRGGYALRKKAVGILIGVPVIVLLNLLRIAFLGWLGGNQPEYFKLFHEYLWEGGFLLVVLLIWMIWVNSFTAETRRRREMTTLALWERAGLILLTTCILLLLSEPYIRTIATSADQMIHAFGLNGGIIRSDGNALFIILWGKAPWEISIGIFYLLPFIALSLLSFPTYPSSPPILGGDEGVVIRQSNHPQPFMPCGYSLTREGRFYQNLFNIGVQTATGTFALFLFHIISVIATYIILLHGGAAWKLTAISAALMVSPLIVYGFLFTVFRANQTGNWKQRILKLKIVNLNRV